MAQTRIVQLVDDLDGSEAIGTFRLSFMDTAVELELSEKNAAKLEKAIQPFMEVGRVQKLNKDGRPRKHAVRGNSDVPAPRSGRVASNATAIRAWAAANGIPVNEKGRISKAIEEQFNAAQPA